MTILPSHICNSHIHNNKISDNTFESIFDKRFPNLPFANPNGGLKQPVGTGTRKKPIGRLGTAVWITGAFSCGYFLGALTECAVDCVE
jgi:hypothetical protein